MLFTMSKRRTHGTRFDLETPLLELAPGAPWTIRDSFQGACVMGSTGSGKSSGSLALLARGMLAAG